MEFEVRRILKSEMRRDRFERGRKNLCDLCNGYSRTLHKHEMFMKSFTPIEEWRDLSESKYLSALLCPECHEGIDHLENCQLLEQNAVWYGVDIVLAEFLRMPLIVRQRLPGYEKSIRGES